MPSPPTAKPIQNADRPVCESSSGNSTTMMVCDADAPSSPAVSAYCFSHTGVRVIIASFAEMLQQQLIHLLRIRATLRPRHHLTYKKAQQAFSSRAILLCTISKLVHKRCDHRFQSVV